MQAESTGKHEKEGFATIEIVIAFAVLILCISAIVMITFGNQILTIDAETNNEAISKAQAVIEKARADSRVDYDSVITSTVVNDGIYQTQTIVDTAHVTDCGKNVKSTTKWVTDSRPLNVEFITHITDIAHALALGGDCDDTLPGAWDNPVEVASMSIGGQGATDVDVRNNLIYLTSAPSEPTKEDFFIFEFDPVTTDLALHSKINVGKGLNAVDVATDRNSGEIYAYVLEKDNVNQLKVINVTNPNVPIVETTATRTLPNMNHTCSPATSPCKAGKSIFYYDSNIYIGTNYIQNLSVPPYINNELHVYDVGDPVNPVWQGSVNVNHNVNSVLARDEHVYLATSDDNAEVHIYNISDPTSIVFEDSFNASGNEDGRSLYFLNDKLYLGRNRTPSTRSDFYILDVADPTKLTQLGEKNLGLEPNAIVTGIVVKGNLAFIGIDDPTSGLQILNISNPSNIINHSACSSFSFSENSTAIDMSGDFVFSVNEINDEIRVISDQVSACTP